MPETSNNREWNFLDKIQVLSCLQKRPTWNRCSWSQLFLSETWEGYDLLRWEERWVLESSTQTHGPLHSYPEPSDTNHSSIYIFIYIGYIQYVSSTHLSKQNRNAGKRSIETDVVILLHVFLVWFDIIDTFVSSILCADKTFTSELFEKRPKMTLDHQVTCHYGPSKTHQQI